MKAPRECRNHGNEANTHCSGNKCTDFTPCPTSKVEECLQAEMCECVCMCVLAPALHLHMAFKSRHRLARLFNSHRAHARHARACTDLHFQPAVLGGAKAAFRPTPHKRHHHRWTRIRKRRDASFSFSFHLIFQFCGTDRSAAHTNGGAPGATAPVLLTTLADRRRRSGTSSSTLGCGCD